MVLTVIGDESYPESLDGRATAHWCNFSNFNDATYSANSNNPTDFMWSGTMETDSNGDEWSGYGGNWDKTMVLEDVVDRADEGLSAELFNILVIPTLSKTKMDPFFTICGMIWL